MLKLITNKQGTNFNRYKWVNANENKNMDLLTRVMDLPKPNPKEEKAPVLEVRRVEAIMIELENFMF